MQGSQRAWRFSLGLSRWIVILAVLAAAWFFGAAEPWESLGVSLVVMAGVLVWLVSVVLNPHVQFRGEAVAVAFLVLVVFLLIQVVPLPAWVVEVLSPRSARLHGESQALFSALGLDQIAGQSGPGTDMLALSVSRPSGLMALSLAAAYLGIFVVMANAFQSWGQIRRAGGVILFSGFIIAVLAIVHKFSGSAKLLWIREPFHGGNLFGPFTNRNHYAFFMNMVFALGLASLLCESSGRGEVRGDEGWRGRLARVATRMTGRGALLAFILVVVGGSVCFSLSRGGLASLVAGVGLVGFLAAAKTRDAPLSRAQASSAILMILGGAVWLGWAPLVRRLGSTISEAITPLPGGRSAAALDTLNMFIAFPVTGSGFGTFESVFPIFQSEVNQPGRFLHAHNDWLQMLAEGGVVGAMLFLVVLTLFIRLLRSRYTKADRYAKRYLVGLTVGFVAAALHSGLDYSLHKPANAMMLAALAGLAVSAMSLGNAQIRDIQDDRNTRSMMMAPCLRRLKPRCIGVCLLLVLSTGMMVAESWAWRGEMAFARLRYLQGVSGKVRSAAEREATVRTAMDEADIVASMAGESSASLRESSLILMSWAVDVSLEPATRLALGQTALRTAVLAVRNSPTDYITWYYAAHALGILGDWDRAEKCLVQAQRLRLSGRRLEFER